MPFNYDPDATGLIPEGTHKLTVVSIEDTVSRAGNEMWIVRLEDDKRREVTEWIVQDDRGVDWKLKPLFIAAQLPWPTGPALIDEQQLVDKTVYATINHEKSLQYGTSARIAGYVSREELTDVPAEQESFAISDERAAVGGRQADDDEEEIPF